MLAEPSVNRLRVLLAWPYLLHKERKGDFRKHKQEGKGGRTRLEIISLGKTLPFICSFKGIFGIQNGEIGHCHFNQHPTQRKLSSQGQPSSFNWTSPAVVGLTYKVRTLMSQTFGADCGQLKR